MSVPLKPCSSSLPSHDIFFPATSTPLIQHGQFCLSGNDCINIAKTIDLFFRIGLTPANCSFFSSLLSVWTFIVLYRHKALTGAASKLQQTLLAEKDIARNNIIMPIQHKQFLLQLKCFYLTSIEANIPDNIEKALQLFSRPDLVPLSMPPPRAPTPLPQKNIDAITAAINSTPPQTSNDCISATIDVMVEKDTVHANKDFNVTLLKRERDRIVNADIKRRLNELGNFIAEARSCDRIVPYWTEISHMQLSLVDLQRKVRHGVLGSIDAEAIRNNTFRSKKEIELEHKARERLMKKAQAQKEKDDKKHRRNFLTVVIQHARDFTSWHRANRKQLSVLTSAIQKYHEDRMKRSADAEKSSEKQRLAALKDNNEEEYLKLLMEAKNERLLSLFRQTDEYMTKLGAEIQREQSQLDSALQKIQSTRPPPIVNEEEVDAAQRDRERVANMEQEERRRAHEREQQAKGNGDDSSASAPSMKEVSARSRYYAMAHKVTEEVIEQPKMLAAGKLRAYQLAGLQWLVSLYNNQLNGILADEMGLGKTVQSLSLLAYLMEVKRNYGPFLIIVPMSTLHNNWGYEMQRWLPNVNSVIYDGDKDHRKLIKDKYIVPGNFNVLMTTFDFAMRDKAVLRKIKWEYIIIDEAHRLKNPKCKLALELASYNKDSRRVALTGTPLQNELPELWSLLNFLHPSIFNSCENFEKWFATPFDKMTVSGQDKEKVGMNEEEKLLVINRLHSILRPFMLRREKKQVETDLADKIEKVIRCELTPVQRVLYQSILDGRVSTQNRVMQLRKVTNHPYLFHPYMRAQAGSEPFQVDEHLINICGKFTLLDQILHKLKRTGHRVLIFNQMTKSMNILEDFMRYRGFTYLRLDGNTSSEDRASGLKLYNAPDSPYFIYMLSTKAGGLGLNLQSADTVILFDSDWNPQNDLQAMARAHRIGQKCFGPGTKFVMYDGTTKCVEDIRRRDVLMGDDGTPRVVHNITGRCNTALDEAEQVARKIEDRQPSMYRIRATKNYASFTCNGLHTLVLRWNEQPFKVEAAASQQNSKQRWGFHRYEQRPDGSVVHAYYYYDSFEERERNFDLAMETWRPLEVEITVDDFFRLCSPTVREAAQLFQTDKPSQFTLNGKSIAAALSDIIGAGKVDQHMIDTTARVLGIYLAHGSEADIVIANATSPDKHDLVAQVQAWVQRIKSPASSVTTLPVVTSQTAVEAYWRDAKVSFNTFTAMCALGPPLCHVDFTHVGIDPCTVRTGAAVYYWCIEIVQYEQYMQWLLANIERANSEGDEDRSRRLTRCGDVVKHNHGLNGRFNYYIGESINVRTRYSFGGSSFKRSSSIHYLHAARENRQLGHYKFHFKVLAACEMRGPSTQHKQLSLRMQGEMAQLLHLTSDKFEKHVFNAIPSGVSLNRTESDTRINGGSALLALLDELGVNQDDKVIPCSLLTESIAVRRQVLLGIMQNSGSWHVPAGDAHSPEYQLKSKSFCYMQTVCHLMRGLGYPAYAPTETQGGQMHQLHVPAVQDLRELMNYQTNRPLPDISAWCASFEIDVLGHGDYYGFKLIGPNQRCLTDEFVVVHNCQVICLRFITTATVEERVLNTAQTKLTHEQMVIQAGMFHEKYSHHTSRQMVAQAMRDTLISEGDDEDMVLDDEAVSRTLARSEEELAIFLKMDSEMKKLEDKMGTRTFPEGKMPHWAFDWCVKGNRSDSIDQRLVPFSDDLLEQARQGSYNHDEGLGSLPPAAPVHNNSSFQALVDVSSDDDEEEVLAESSGVNDALLNQDTCGMDDDEDEQEEDDACPPPLPPSAATNDGDIAAQSSKKRKRESDDTSRKRTKSSSGATTPNTDMDIDELDDDDEQQEQEQEQQPEEEAPAKPTNVFKLVVNKGNASSNKFSFVLKK